MAWNQSALLALSQATSSREVLTGARSGTIYEADGAKDLFKSTDRYLQHVFSMPEKQPITELRFDISPPGPEKDTSGRHYSNEDLSIRWCTGEEG